MNRRDVLKAGASLAALPAIGPAQILQVAAAGWKPSVLTDEQNAAVITLTDLIIPATDTPGAKAANVNRYIDLFLRDGPASERDRFLKGLQWLDDYARKTGGAPFVKLTPEQQTSILRTLDTSQSAGLAPGNQFFRYAKAFTSRIYYNTEIGYRELNKAGVPGSFACSHDAH